MPPDASEVRDHRRRGRERRVACLVVLLIALSLPLRAGSAASRAQMVGVVDFYAPTPLGTFDGLVPEQFAADDLTTLLTRAAGERVVMMSRDKIRQAETTVRWRDGDVLHFDRLSALARDAGADWLIAGWITELTVEIGGTGMMPPDDGNGAPSAEATIDVQVFNVKQGRIVSRAHQRSTALGAVRTQLAAGALHQALEPTVPAIMRALTAQAP